MQYNKEEVRILIVDDEKEQFRTISIILTQNGYNQNNFVFAENGKDALEKLEKREIDIILMDIQMPKMDGMTAVKKIRENGYIMPIIMVTNTEAQDGLEEALAINANMYVEKSNLEYELIPKLELQLRNYYYMIESKIEGFRNLKYFFKQYKGSFNYLVSVKIVKKDLYWKYYSMEEYHTQIFKQLAQKFKEIKQVVDVFVYANDSFLLCLNENSHNDLIEKLCEAQEDQTYIMIQELCKTTDGDEKHKIIEELNKVKTIQININNEQDFTIVIDLQINILKVDSQSSNQELYRKVIIQEDENFDLKRDKLRKYMKALEGKNCHRIEPDFQPIRDQYGNIVKFEALARVVYDDKRESIYSYLETVNLTGTQTNLTKIMIEKSLKKFSESAIFKNKAVGISINITSEDLLDGNLLELLDENRKNNVKDIRDFSPDRITLEILERDKLSKDLLDAIHTLEKKGYKIAIDDFGVECSSFDKVSDIARDLILKIDGKFIKDIKVNKRHQKIVKSIALAANELNYLTVAEYVEDERTLEMLKEFGIDLFQGFYKEGRPKSTFE